MKELRESHFQIREGVRTGLKTLMPVMHHDDQHTPEVLQAQFLDRPLTFSQEAIELLECYQRAKK